MAESINNILRFYWVRHLPINKEGIYIGKSDVPAEIPPFPANSAMLIPQGAVWYSSPLLRSVQTANWLMETYSGKEEKLNIAAELSEQDFGKWEGKSYEEVWKNEEKLHDWLNMASVKPQGGESFSELCDRFDGWLEKQVKLYSNTDDMVIIAVVAHAGTIRAAIRNALEISAEKALSFNIDYGSLTQIDYLAGSGVRVNCVNR
ncbi:MAG: histidine phosphatase family protein [Rickettsiales bacterium]